MYLMTWVQVLEVVQVQIPGGLVLLSVLTLLMLTLLTVRRYRLRACLGRLQPLQRFLQFQSVRLVLLRLVLTCSSTSLPRGERTIWLPGTSPGER
jgi:hypothetical protein